MDKVLPGVPQGGTLRSSEMAEEKRISPGVVIVGGLGLGLAAAVGVAALAWAVPPTPPPGRADLYGKVTDAATGAALANVTVELWSPDGTELLLYTTTDSSGRYSMADILPGNYLVYFKKEGYETEVR